MEGRSGHGDEECSLDFDGYPQNPPGEAWSGELGMRVLRPRADVWGGSSSAWVPHLCLLTPEAPAAPHPCCSPFQATTFSGLRPFSPTPCNSRSGPAGQGRAVNMSSRAPHQPENKNDIPAMAPHSQPQPPSPATILVCDPAQSWRGRTVDAWPSSTGVPSPGDFLICLALCPLPTLTTQETPWLPLISITTASLPRRRPGLGPGDQVGTRG